MNTYTPAICHGCGKPFTANDTNIAVLPGKAFHEKCSPYMSREDVEAVEMENKRLSKENDRLREELEKVKGSWFSPDEMRMVKDAQSSHVRNLNGKLTTIKTALAAAKEALEKVMREHSMTMQEVSEIGHSEGFALKPSLFDSVRNALARIAECEKETA